ncbi:MAG TPA: 50S ribosomal protein L19 [Holophaga sp.]|nr:50S ribosomal protein L19 [Holophaga sp.]HPS67207.1 50S ribosomal protein L19 [Holophaga sp.]
MNIIDRLEATLIRKDLPRISPGDTVKVHVKVREGEKERIQVFQGVVIGIRGGGLRTSFTVRKISEGVGVERIFPLNSPSIDHMDVVRSGKVRRAKLYFLREKLGKAGRLKERRRVELSAE